MAAGGAACAASICMPACEGEFVCGFWLACQRDSSHDHPHEYNAVLDVASLNCCWDGMTANFKWCDTGVIDCQASWWTSSALAGQVAACRQEDRGGLQVGGYHAAHAMYAPPESPAVHACGVVSCCIGEGSQSSLHRTCLTAVCMPCCL